MKMRVDGAGEDALVGSWDGPAWGEDGYDVGVDDEEEDASVTDASGRPNTNGYGAADAGRETRRREPELGLELAPVSDGGTSIVVFAIERAKAMTGRRICRCARYDSVLLGGSEIS